MPSARLGASPRPAGGARRQRAPAGLAPAGGLARGPSHAPRPGPGPAVPQPTAQQEPGSPGQWALRPPRPGVLLAEHPDPRAVERRMEPLSRGRAAPTESAVTPVPDAPELLLARVPCCAVSHSLPRVDTPLLGDGLGAAACIQPQTWPRVHTPTQPSPLRPRSPRACGVGGDRGLPGVTQGSSPRGASQRPGGEGRTSQAPAQVGQGAPTPTLQAPDTQPGVCG